MNNIYNFNNKNKTNSNNKLTILQTQNNSSISKINIQEAKGFQSENYNSFKENSQYHKYNISNESNGLNNVSVKFERLSKIKKERLSATLKKNTSKKKESYMNTEYSWYSKSKSNFKSPNSFSKENEKTFGVEDFQNNTKYYGKNNEKINQRQLSGIKNEIINEKLINERNNLEKINISKLNLSNNISNNINDNSKLNNNIYNSKHVNVNRANNLKINEKPLSTSTNEITLVMKCSLTRSSTPL